MVTSSRRNPQRSLLLRSHCKVALAIVLATIGVAGAADETPATIADIPVSRCAEQLLEDDIVIPAGLTECRAYLAVYLDKDGRFMYLENVYNDPRRLIQTIPIYPRHAQGCAGGAKCFICVGLRCGCVC